MNHALHIVTGASRGIGYEVVLHLASFPNTSILATARNASALAKLSENARDRRLPGQIIHVPADLTLPEGRASIVESVQRILDSQPGHALKGILQNAGTLTAKPFLEQTGEEWDRQYEVLLKAPALLTRDLFDLMGHACHVVFVSSMGGFQGSRKFPGLTPYSTLKGGLSILAECLAEEFAAHAPDKELACNALCLGAVQTQMLEEAFPGLQAPVDAQTMGGWIANFLISAGALFNGKILPISLRDPG